MPQRRLRGTYWRARPVTVGSCEHSRASFGSLVAAMSRQFLVLASETTYFPNGGFRIGGLL